MVAGFATFSFHFSPINFYEALANTRSGCYRGHHPFYREEAQAAGGKAVTGYITNANGASCPGNIPGKLAPFFCALFWKVSGGAVQDPRHATRG